MEHARRPSIECSLSSEEVSNLLRCPVALLIARIARKDAAGNMWAWMGAMGVSRLPGIVSPDYHVYKMRRDLLPDYVDLLCRARPFVAEVNRWSKGVWSSRLRLYPENFFEMRLPVPPHDQQLEIVRAVETGQCTANALRDSLQSSIALARERRTALITAAVTGQMPLVEMASTETREGEGAAE